MTPGASSVMVRKADLKYRFELSCDIFAKTYPDAHLIGMLATLASYRDFIQTNVRQAGPVDPRTFVGWMRSAERDPSQFPEPWAADLVALFDGLLVDAVEDENVQPGTVIDALDEWLSSTQREVTQIHGLPEGFFNV